MKSLPFEIIIVSFKGSERIGELTKTLLEKGLRFTIVYGVRGRLLSEKKISKLSPKYLRVLGLRRRGMFASEIGCYLSHMLALKYFIETQKEFALFLEDDVVFEDSLLDMLNELSNKNFGDVCFLGSAHRDRRFGNYTLKEFWECAGTKFYCINHGLRYAQGLFIKRDFALKRIRWAFPILRPLDNYDHLPTKFRYSVTIPRIVNQNGGITSEIDPENKLVVSNFWKLIFCTLKYWEWAYEAYLRCLLRILVWSEVKIKSELNELGVEVESCGGTVR